MRNSKKRPNILFVCSDQQHWAKNSVNGHPLVKTPNMQRLADMGVNFRNCYSNSPVCAPARASLFTGRFPSDIGAYDNAAPLKPEYKTFGTLARENGYLAWATGKLDFHYNCDYGFEEHKTGHGHDPSPDITAFCRKPVIRRPEDMENVQDNVRDEVHGDHQTTTLTAEFLCSDRAINPDKPWLTWCGWSAPHNPYRAPEKYMKMYPLDEIDLPCLPEGWKEKEHPVWNNTRFQRCCDVDIPEERIRRDRAAYYGLITELDEQLGELLEVLENTGQLENTIIIFTSDHGDMMGEHGFFYKNAPYEDAAKVPLIIAGPGLPKGVNIEHPVSLVDLFPTILDIVGGDMPSVCRGNSLLPMIQGEKDGPPYAYMELNTERVETGVFTIVQGRWKYNYYVGYEDQLFNLDEDPHEWDNRIDDPACAGTRDRLKDILFSICDPETVSREAFEDQKRRLVEFTGSDKRSYEDMLADRECFEQFSKRLGEERAKSFLKKHFDEMQA